MVSDVFVAMFVVLAPAVSVGLLVARVYQSRVRGLEQELREAKSRLPPGPPPRGPTIYIPPTRKDH